MAAFESYIDAAALSLRTGSGSTLSITQHRLLNGEPYRAFRESIDLAERRTSGTFFTGSTIAGKLAAMLRSEMSPNATILDPTCGMGDLLLAYASELPIGPTLRRTLTLWGTQLAGLDLRADLIRMAKIRLAALAQMRGGFSDSVDNIDSHFPLIRVGNALTEPKVIRAADGFLFNPPFGQIVSTEPHTWSDGRINAAAIFLDVIIKSRRPAAPIAAVLPEVLRCGTRYGRFREFLSANSLGGRFESLGRFDAWTDIDVFATLLKNSEGSALWHSPTFSTESSVGDRFVIRVGTVVPHRHREDGPERPYLCAKSTPAWNMGFEAAGVRQFAGTAFQPPFVVVRRTSSPSDKSRAVGSIIKGKNLVAVENHLIVATPLSGGMKSCEALIKVLRHPETSIHLNNVIRCRHLTTASVKAIPWRSMHG